MSCCLLCHFRLLRLCKSSQACATNAAVQNNVASLFIFMAPPGLIRTQDVLSMLHEGKGRAGAEWPKRRCCKTVAQTQTLKNKCGGKEYQDQSSL